MGRNLEQIEQYYSNEHKGKIFCTRMSLQGKSFDILYNYDKINEIEKFVSNFSEYLPYYVYNADTLECIDTTGDFSLKLFELSKQCWYGPNIPSRETKVNGIFGEVFLDFYERVVKGAKLASTYASRRNFDSNNENKGYDNVLFIIKPDSVEYVFAESKFVATKSKATEDLLIDIKGEPASGHKKEKVGHLTRNYMNRYITFIVEKGTYFSDEDKSILRPFINDLNNVLINEGRDFISFLINRNIRVNCVFFAIFQDQHFNPNAFISEYDKIEEEARRQLKNIGFTNYGIEIVFIPTSSKSMTIKGAINEHYEQS